MLRFGFAEVKVAIGSVAEELCYRAGHWGRQLCERGIAIRSRGGELSNVADCLEAGCVRFVLGRSTEYRLQIGCSSWSCQTGQQGRVTLTLNLEPKQLRGHRGSSRGKRTISTLQSRDQVRIMASKSSCRLYCVS